MRENQAQDEPLLALDFLETVIKGSTQKLGPNVTLAHVLLAREKLF